MYNGKFYFEEEKFKLIKEDTFNALKDIKEKSFDMIFADPPYFLSNNGITCSGGKMVSVNKGTWDKTLDVKSKHDFNRKWINECYRVLKDNGTIWISGTLHNIYSIGMALEEEGFKIINNITWQKTNPPPNLACKTFTHSTETILWARKDLPKVKYSFNYDLMKSLNDNKQMKDVWTTSLTRPSEKKQGKHPTQKPLEILDKIILASTKENDLILDPFCGSSTTGVSASKLNRQYIGIDNSEEYLDLSVRRYKEIEGAKFMKKGGKAGINTKTGLKFEGKTDLATFLDKQKGYEVKDEHVYYNGKLVARVFKKYRFYNFLEEYGIEWNKIIRRQLLPDDCIFVIIENKLFIIECKFQQVEGSVDEKLQTCDFKKKQYQKLLAKANIDVEYVYLLSEWFKNEKYQDVLDYIHSVGCYYYFEYIPLNKLGLPVPEIDE